MTLPTDQIEHPVDQAPVEVVSDAESSTEEKTDVERVTIRGEELVAKVKELIHEGNIRRIMILNDEGKTLLEIPLTVGVMGTVLSATLFPVLAALAVIGALVAHLTLVIDKQEQE